MIQKIDLKEDFVLIKNHFIDLGKVVHVEIGSHGIFFTFIGDSRATIYFSEEIPTEDGGTKCVTPDSYHTVVAFLKKRFKPKIITEDKILSKEERKEIADKLNILYPA